MIFDLKHRVEISHLKNRTTLANGHLDIRLVKQEPGTTWGSLEFTGTKEEKRERRELSIKRYDEFSKEASKKQDETKLTLDKAALDKQMEIEEYERRYIKNKKEEEKRYVEDKLYEDLEEIEQLNEKLKQGYDPKLIQSQADEISKRSITRIDPTHKDTHHEDNKVVEVDEPSLDDHIEEKKEAPKVKKASLNSKMNDPSKNIFDDAD